MYLALGRKHAKIGACLVTASTALPYLLIAIEMRISQGTFIMISALNIVGLVMIFSALAKYGYRARWIAIFLGLYATLLLFNPPVGTAVALFTYYYLLKNWRSFSINSSRD